LQCTSCPMLHSCHCSMCCSCPTVSWCTHTKTFGPHVRMQAADPDDTCQPTFPGLNASAHGSRRPTWPRWAVEALASVDAATDEEMLHGACPPLEKVRTAASSQILGRQHETHRPHAVHTSPGARTKRGHGHVGGGAAVAGWGSSTSGVGRRLQGLQEGAQQGEGGVEDGGGTEAHAGFVDGRDGQEGAGASQAALQAGWGQEEEEEEEEGEEAGATMSTELDVTRSCAREWEVDYMAGNPSVSPLVGKLTSVLELTPHQLSCTPSLCQHSIQISWCLVSLTVLFLRWCISHGVGIHPKHRAGRQQLGVCSTGYNAAQQWQRGDSASSHAAAPAHRSQQGRRGHGISHCNY
jgi:hypothetical protein